MSSDGRVTVAGALASRNDDSTPGGRELVRRVEELPWNQTWVESSTVDRIAWCESSKVPFAQRPGAVFPVVDPGLSLGWLWVQFKSGTKVYAYQDVPRPIYEAIVRAESPGGAHAELVKGHYNFAAADLRNGQTFVQA